MAEKWLRYVERIPMAAKRGMKKDQIIPLERGGRGRRQLARVAT
jgi:hypothetical protein